MHKGNQNDPYLDKAGVEQCKTNFYNLEGWDAKTGWPTRKTLEGLVLKKVANAMASKGRLGALKMGTHPYLSCYFF